MYYNYYSILPVFLSSFSCTIIWEVFSLYGHSDRWTITFNWAINTKMLYNLYDSIILCITATCHMLVISSNYIYLLIPNLNSIVPEFFGWVVLWIMLRLSLHNVMLYLLCLITADVWLQYLLQSELFHTRCSCILRILLWFLTFYPHTSVVVLMSCTII